VQIGVTPSAVVTHRSGSMQRLVSLALVLASICVIVAARSDDARVLVFSKTAGCGLSHVPTTLIWAD
jgi:hypothetical protein